MHPDLQFPNMSESESPLTEAFIAADAALSEVNADIDASASSGWFRLEFALAGVLALLFAGYLLAYFVFDVDLNDLRSWGYLGIFFIALAGSATIVLPTPSSVAIFSGGVLLHPVMGIPAPLLVGLVAAAGDALGEFTGYALGYAGTDIIKHQKLYRTFEGWMTTHGMLSIFLLSTFPNPMFDIAGAAAGATRMPPQRFFTATLAGKLVKDLILAYGGTFSFGLAREIF